MSQGKKKKQKLLLVSLATGMTEGFVEKSPPPEEGGFPFAF
jgi:hypothetical protein